MMAANKLWLFYRWNFPGCEEVKRTEKYMSNICVVPKLSMKPSLQHMVRRPQVFPVCM